MIFLFYFNFYMFYQFMRLLAELEMLYFYNNLGRGHSGVVIQVAIKLLG